MHLKIHNIKTKRSYYKRQDSQGGMTLTETLLAITVISIVVFSTMQFFSYINREKQKTRLRNMQKTIAASLRNAVKSPANIFYSVSRYDINPVLSSCILKININGKSGDCSLALNRSNPVSFALYSVTSQDGMQGIQISSGENGTPVYYDINGKQCKNQKDKNCFFEAKTMFYASCKGDGSSLCPQGASQISFTYSVEIRKSIFQDLFGLWSIPPYPKKRQYISMTPGQILGPDRNSQCGSDAFNQGTSDIPADKFQKFFSTREGFFGTLTGYDAYGRPECECLYPFEWVGDEEDPETGITYPVCRLMQAEQLACQTGSYLRGVHSEKDDKSVICKNNREAFECTEDEPTKDSCPDGYFLMQYVRSQCLFRCQYIPDQERICDFIWNPDKGSEQITKAEESGGVDVRFTCDVKEKKCCRPRMYSQ